MNITSPSLYTMDVRFLATFLEVADTRHFGKAAENLYLTPSAVSARIKQLEEYFNANLFERHRNRIQLTPAGEALLPFARQMSQQLQQAKKALARQSVDHLVIGATPNAWELYLSAAIGPLKQGCDELTLRVELQNKEVLTRQLHERVVDIGVVHQPIKSDEVTALSLGSFALSLYRRNSPAPADTLEFVQVDWGDKLQQQLTPALGHTVTPALNTGSVRVALDYLLQQDAMAMLPQALVSPYLHSGALAAAAPELSLSLPLYLCYLKSAGQDRLQQIIPRFADAGDVTNQDHNRGRA